MTESSRFGLFNRRLHPVRCVHHTPSAMTRRDFIVSSTAATALVPLARAAAVAPIPVIDTHTHFYDPDRPQGVPWPPKTETLLHRTVLPREYRKLTAPFHVVGTVIVEASEWVEDNQWILDLAKNDSLIVGFVGHLKPGQPGFAANFRRFSASPLFRGLRIRPADLKNVGDAGFDADLRRVADAGLAIDTLGGPAALAPTLKLSTAFPSLRLVIDHLPFKEWDGNPAAMRAALGELAARPNVFAKVSEVVRRVGGKVVDDPAHYRPGLDVLCDLFGPNRIVFGSNWPVSDKIAPYAKVHRVVADYFAAKSRAEVEQYFWRNSRAAYRWVPRGATAALV